MKIALDNRAIHFSGIGVYTHNLYQGLNKLGISVILYNDNLLISRQNFIAKYVNFAKRLILEQIYLNKWLKKNNIELFHGTWNIGIPLLTNKNVVVTIHDIIPHIYPKYYLNNYLERIYYELAIRISIYRSRKIITISDFSKRELIKHYGVKNDKISVVPLAYNSVFRVIDDVNYLQKVKTKYSIKDKYILTIGGSEYRKNVEILIKVFLNSFSDNYKLIVIGNKWRNMDLSAKYKNNKIEFLSNVPETDLVAIYNMAEIFVFPSFYEGFGIPILEGMACGVPVITSNVAAMPEVGGEAALYFDPFDENDIDAKIRQVLYNENLKKEMIFKGLERVKRYTWDKCVKETLNVYLSIEYYRRKE